MQLRMKMMILSYSRACTSSSFYPGSYSCFYSCYRSEDAAQNRCVCVCECRVCIVPCGHTSAWHDRRYARHDLTRTREMHV